MSRIVIEGLTTLLPSMSRLSRQCGILNMSQPYRPPRPLRGIAFILPSSQTHRIKDRRMENVQNCDSGADSLTAIYEPIV
jgi:hypothetical protein